MPTVPIGSILNNGENLVINIDSEDRRIFIGNTEVQYDFFKEIENKVQWLSEQHKAVFIKLFENSNNSITPLRKKENETVVITQDLSKNENLYPPAKEDFILITKVSLGRAALLSFLASFLVSIFVVLPIVFFIVLTIPDFINLFSALFITGAALIGGTVSGICFFVLYNLLANKLGISFTTD